MPPEFLALWTSAPQDLPLPVFDGIVVQRRGEIAIIGGFTAGLNATPAIQIRHPTRGWQPIGSQMLEARALHTVTPLSDGRVLIVGGVQGVLGRELLPLASAEVLNPFVAGSMSVPSIDEPLVGHTAHALGNGRVVVIGASGAYVFDEATMSWTARVPLAHARRNHASIVLHDGSILVVGGEGEHTIERTHVASSRLESVLWEQTLPIACSHTSLASLPDGRVWVVGGMQQDSGRSTDRSWIIDPAVGTIIDGPNLALDRGVCGVSLFREGGRMIALGGEWVDGNARGPSNVARLFDARANRLWSLPAIPNDASRRMWYFDDRDRPAAIGGYRFVTPDEAAVVGVAAGPSVLTDAIALDLGRLPTPLD